MMLKRKEFKVESYFPTESIGIKPFPPPRYPKLSKNENKVKETPIRKKGYFLKVANSKQSL